MDQGLKELTTILSREQEIFQGCLELLIEQQNHLMSNDIDGIQATVEKINALSQEAANLENGRRRLLDRITRASRLKPEEIDLTKLLEKLGGPIFQEFVRLKDTLIDIQEKINEQRVRNELLIDQSMRVISHSKLRIHETGSPKATHENHAQIKGSQGLQGTLISRMA